MPTLSELDSLRRTSATGQSSAGVMFLASADAVKLTSSRYGGPSNYSYRLVATGEDPSWVIFAFGPEWKTSQGLPGGGDPSAWAGIGYEDDHTVVGTWLGVADFAAGVWRWRKAIPDSQDYHADRKLDDVLQPLSPDGFVYLVAAISGAGNTAYPIAALNAWPQIQYTGTP